MMRKTMASCRTYSLTYLLARIAACFVVFILTSSLSPQLLALAVAKITVKTIPAEIYENESFNLIFQTIDSVDGAPDFSPLEQNFTITQKTQRNNFTMFSGDFGRSDNWTVELIPDKAGSITIPAIAFGKDRSPSIVVTVKPRDKHQNPSEREFISELEVDNNTVFVHSQIIVTQRMLSTRRTARPSFSDLTFSGVAIMQEKLDDGHSFDIERNGTTYHVIEVKTAVHPLQAGELKINSSVAVAQVAASGDGSINPLINNAITKNASSAPVSIQINPTPAAYKQQNWLPAKEVRLQEVWPVTNTEFKVGEPITRIFSIYVDGQRYSQLPQLSLVAVDDLKRYPDKPINRNTISASGITSTRKIRLVLIPTRVGSYMLPAVELPWWNTLSNSMQVATIPPRSFSVTDNISKSAFGKTIKKETTEIDTDKMDTTAGVTKSDDARFYLWLSIFLAMGWVSTILLWADINRARKKQKLATYQAQPKDLYQAGKNLKKACDNAQALACQHALLAWGRIIFNDNSITNLGTLGHRVDGVLQVEIKKLEMALYSPNDSDWDADKIWQHSLKVDHRRPTSKTSDKLEPMYH